MPQQLLLLAATAAVFASASAGAAYIETRYGGRKYYCRDRYGFVGDCTGGAFRRREDYDYGHRESRYGRRIGQGFYTMIGDRDAEMVCDFSRNGGVRDDVVDIVWWKVYDDDDNDDDDYNHRRGRYFRRYDSLERRRGADRHRRSRYRYSYRRHHDGADRHYRRARHFNYRPGQLRDETYINGYRNWYNDDHFGDGLRVTTRGDRSTLYIRDISPADLGLYRCQGRLRSTYGRDLGGNLIYMDVEFQPTRKYD